MIEFLVGLMVTITGYAPVAGGINCGYDCNLTASGMAPAPHVAACGPAWETGDWLWVDGEGAVVCGDRIGRPLTPSHVELYFASSQEAMEWGVQSTSVVKIGHTRLCETLPGWRLRGQPVPKREPVMFCEARRAVRCKT